MTRERFEDLAQAYGGAIARWPAAERDAAYQVLREAPEFAQAALSQAEALDAALDAWRPPAVSHDLRERVVAAAIVAVRRAGRLTWLWGAGAGAGLAAASAAGLIVGVALSGQTANADEPVSSVMTSYDMPSQTDTPEAAT